MEHSYTKKIRSWFKHGLIAVAIALICFQAFGDAHFDKISISGGTTMAPALTFGDAGAGFYKSGSEEVNFSVRGNEVANFSINGLGLFNPIYAPSFSGQDPDPATNGTFNLSNGFGIEWRNAGNTSDLGLYLDSSNIFQLGSSLTVNGTLTATTISGSFTGNASTATALAANPTDCASDTYATTIGANGNLTCATVTNAGLAGSIARSKILAGTANHVVINDGSGNLSSEATVAKSRGGTAQDNSSLTFPAAGTVPGYNPVNHGVIMSSGGSVANVTTAGTSGQPLLSGGASADGAYGNLGAAAGGTSQTSYTKGDILVASGATTLNKQAVGTNGYTIIADSSQTNGLKWAPASGGGGTVGKNIIVNGDFELGSASNWTASGGSLADATSGTELLDGAVSATWDSGSAGQTLSSDSVTIPKGLYGNNGLAFCKIRTPSGSATHLLELYDGSNVIASTAIVSSTTPQYTTLNFIFPASGSIVERLKSVAANEPSITVDNCVVAEAANITNISQASLYGAALTPSTTNCNWTTGAAAAFTAFGADSDCPTPTLTSNASAPGTKIPAITFTSLPPGEYLFLAYGGLRSGTTAGDAALYEFYDGTNEFGNGYGVSAATSQRGTVATLSGRIRYTTAQSNVTIQLRVKDFGGTSGGNLLADGMKFEIMVYRFPLSNEQAYNPNQMSGSWSGIHDSTCSFARTNSSYGDPATDASCALTERTNQNFGTVTGSNNLPSITFTPKRAGRYLACAMVQSLCATSTDHCSHRLWDGTTVIAEGNYRAAAANFASTTPLCGLYVANGTSAVTLSVQSKSTSGALTIISNSADATIDWSIIQIDQAFPTPVIVNSVITPLQDITTVNAYVSKSSTYTATKTDETISFSSSATLNLPAAASFTGKKYFVVASGAGTKVTIDPNSSETVCGQSTINVNGEGDSVTIQSNGTNWIGLGNSCLFTSSARMACTGSSSITSQYPGNWISTIGNSTAGGLCTVTFVSGIYSGAPNCGTTIGTEVSSDPLTIAFATRPDTSSFVIDAADNAGSDNTSYTFDVHCTGQR